MRMHRSDLFLDPVRLRIILAFAGGRELTPQQVADVLPGVPQATLYQNIERLYRGGVLALATEKEVGNPGQPTYVLAAGSENLAKSQGEGHLDYSTAFVAGFIAQFDQYLERSEIDLSQDGVCYRRVVVNLTDEVLMEMARALDTALGRLLADKPKGRSG